MKRFWAIFFIILFSCLIFIVKKSLPDFYFNTGKTFYLKNDYQSALTNLRLSNLLNPSNRDSRYYYVETLIKLPPTVDNQKAIYEISQSKTFDSAQLIAEQKIANWRNQILAQAGENYIQQAPYNDGILRWDESKFPIKVGFENTQGLPDYYISTIEKAFTQWQNLSNNLVSFAFVNNINDADIKIKFEPFNQKKCEDSNCKYTVAYTEPTISGGDLLKNMTITFYEANNLGQPFKQAQIYNTALHEIGHSLGIMGHSPNKDDIMYMETNPNGANQFGTVYQNISSNDLNTLALLYKLIPDITNTNIENLNTKYKLFASIVMGSEKQIVTQKMVEAQNYINAAPDLPNGYIDLASAYAESKEYAQAISTLNKALVLCSNDSEKFIIYYNFAVIYMQIKDWHNVINYAQIAKQYNSNSDLDGIIAMAYFNLGDKENAKSLYTQALQKDPSNIIDAYNLATIYIKEYNFVQAGKTLNALIAANPEAKNDPKIKRYFLFLMFR